MIKAPVGSSVLTYTNLILNRILESGHGLPWMGHFQSGYINGCWGRHSHNNAQIEDSHVFPARFDEVVVHLYGDMWGL